MGRHSRMGRHCRSLMRVLPAEGFECEISRERLTVRHGHQLRPLIGSIKPLICCIARYLQQQHVCAHRVQQAQKHQFMRGDSAALVEDARRLIIAQKRHQPLEAVIQPAHHLEIDIAEHRLRLACLTQLRDLAQQRLREFRAVAAAHARHPCGQLHGQERICRLKVAAERFLQVSQLPFIRIADLSLDDGTLHPCRLMIQPERIQRIRACLMQANEINTLSVGAFRNGKHQILKRGRVDSGKHGFYLRML